jgi:excisionase family DNA binding protein
MKAPASSRRALIQPPADTVTTRLAAAIANVSERTIRRHAEAGSLRAVRVGERAWHVKRDALEAWIAGDAERAAVRKTEQPDFLDKTA